MDETYIWVKGQWYYLYRAVDKTGQTIDFLLTEQDHRDVKRVTRPMFGFKSFAAAQCTLVGVERMHMLKKKQLVVEAGQDDLLAAAQFYALAT